MTDSISRRLWQALEPYHAVVYFAPEAKQAFSASGLSGFWMGYFASRSAPLGPVPAGVVAATFFGFDPAMVSRAVPAAWEKTSPAAITEVRLAIADAALRRLFGDGLSSAGLDATADATQEAAEAADIAGRPLFAAYRSLRWPEEPHLRLWHGATLLREHRGDGHVAALVLAGLDGCEAQVLQTATGVVDRALLQPTRGWSDEAWEGATRRLIDRGWLDPEGRITTDGAKARADIETGTDVAAEGPWTQVGRRKSERLLAAMGPISQLIVDRGGLPFPNPIGLTV